MSPAVVIVTVVVVVAAAVAAGVLVWLKRGRGSAERREASAAVASARRDLKMVTRVRDSAVKIRRKEVDKAQKEYERGVKAAESYLRQLRDPKGAKVASYRGVTLYERWIETPHGSGSVEGATAIVDAQLSSRFTATRLVALGVFALAFKKKTGAVYLQIDGPHVASVVECPKDDNTKAREFAVKVTNVGKQAQRLIAELPGKITSAENQLARAKANTAAPERARQALAATERDPQLTAPIAEAQAKVDALDPAKATTTPGADVATGTATGSGSSESVDLWPNTGPEAEQSGTPEPVLTADAAPVEGEPVTSPGRHANPGPVTGEDSAPPA